MKLGELPLKPTPRMLRQFSAAWFVVFAGCALFQEFREHDRSLALLLGAVSVLGIAGFVWPRGMKWVFIAATVVTFPIGWLVSNVILALMYYLVITPIGWFLRLRGRDELQLRRKPGSETYWIERRAEPKPENYLKPF